MIGIDRATTHMLRKAGAQRMDNRGAAESVRIQLTGFVIHSQLHGQVLVACMAGAFATLFKYVTYWAVNLSCQLVTAEWPVAVN